MNDVEGNFDGGKLSVSISTGQVVSEDVWGIRNEGDGVGQIGVSGTVLSFGGTVIGAISNGSTMEVTFNANADSAAISATIQNVIYLNTEASNPTSGARVMDFVLEDGDGLASNVSQVTINVASNAAPESITSTSFATEDDSSFLFAVTGSDADGSVASFRISSLPANGTLYIDSGLATPVTIGSVHVASFNTATFYYVPNPNFNGFDTFEFVAIDDHGLEDSTPGTKTLSVASVNDAPELDNTGVNSIPTINEDAFDTSGDTVANLIASAGGDSITDVDLGAVEGIGIYNADSPMDRGSIQQTEVEVGLASETLRLRQHYF